MADPPHHDLPYNGLRPTLRDGNHQSGGAVQTSTEGPYSAMKLPGSGVHSRMSPGGSFMDTMRATLAHASAEAARTNAASPISSGWGDTPDSADMEFIAQLERDAMSRRVAPLGSDVNNTSGISPAMPKQLAFASPAMLMGGQSGAGVVKKERGSSGKRQARQPSNLGPHHRDSYVPAVGDSQMARPLSAKRQRLSTAPAAGLLPLAAAGMAVAPLLDTTNLPFYSATPPLATTLPATNPPQEAPRSPAAAYLEAYLPPEVCEAMHDAGGPRVLYPWQAECLCKPGVLQGRNLVYCAPTSGGKSLVAEVLMLRRLSITGRPALLVLPFISLCTEKSTHLRRLLAPLKREVLDLYGTSQGSMTLVEETGIIVCTIEKANILINQLLEKQEIGLLSCVCIDELHMVGDEDRGYQLELLLTKLRYAGAAAFPESGTSPPTPDNIMGSQDGVQVVGMSATLPNVDAVAKWLGAELFTTSFRPIPLKVFLKVKTEVQDAQGNVVRTISPPPAWLNKDPDLVGWLAQETVADGHSVLVFCAARKDCERTATSFANLLNIPERYLPWRPPADSVLAGNLPADQPPNREAFCRILGNNAAAHPELLAAVSRGVAFHHAGLENEDRELVEAAFRCGAISILCATSTLAAGVNLPARRVIFKHPYIGVPQNFLDSTKFWQMAGRAGRAGVDTEGEAYLVSGKDAPKPRLQALMRSTAAPIESCLTEDKKGMKRAMLEVVASGAVLHPDDVKRYIECTLLFATNASEVVTEATKAALVWLGDKDRNFLSWDKQSETFLPSSFGKAVLASGLPPEVCMHIRSDLARARDAFVLTTELHLTFLCIPATEDMLPDYKRMLKITESMKPCELSVASKVGLDDEYIIYRARDYGPRGPAATSGPQSEKERVCRRFWAALILTDMLQEMNLSDVQEKYGIARGAAEGLQDRASRYAGMIAAFCERLGWHDLEMLIAKFQARVLAGVRPEIMPLVEIPYVKAYTARLLYRAGVRTPEAIAAIGDPEKIVTILSGGRRVGGRDQAEQNMLKQQAMRIIRGARNLLADRAQRLRREATAALRVLHDAEGGGDDGQAMTVGRIVPREGSAGSRLGLPAPRAQGWQQQQQQYGAAQAPPYAAAPIIPMPPALPPLPPLPPPQPSAHINRFSDPDPWEGGTATGITMLSTRKQVHAVCAYLERQQSYARFGFQFDIAAPKENASAGIKGCIVPAGPSASRASSVASGSTGAAAGGGGSGASSASGPNSASTVVGVALSWRAGQVFYVPLQGRPDLVPVVASLFSNARLEKVTFDLKTQIAALASVSSLSHPPLVLLPPYIDVRIAAFLLSPDELRLSDGVPPPPKISSTAAAAARAAMSAPYTPESLAEIHLGPVAVASTTQGLQIPVGGTPPATLRRIETCRSAVLVHLTHAQLSVALEEDSMVSALVDVEMPLVPLLADMEACGIAVDHVALKSELPAIQRRLKELERLAVELVGVPIVLTATSDCSRALYEILALPPPPSATSTFKGNGFSTRAEALEELALNHPECPLPGIISEHRSLTKHLAFCEDLLRCCRASGASGSASPPRIRGRFNQTRAVTGRLTMDEPNLQQVPRSMSFSVSGTPPIKGAPGLENSSSASADTSGRRMQTCNIRRAFVAPPGRVLLSADFRQIELRLVAHFSKDPVLMRMLSDGQADPFKGLAAEWLRVSPPSMVTPEQRTKAKHLAYGLLYGMGNAALARELGFSGLGAESKAVAAAAAFLDALPGVKTWMAEVRRAACSSEGVLRTLSGRARRFPAAQLHGPDSDRQLRARVERQAVNSVAQGSAADVAKLAMVAVLRRVGSSARLIHCIHDEFLYEVDAGRVREVGAEIVAAMESVVSLSVPLRVRLMSGPSWGEMEEVRDLN